MKEDEEELGIQVCAMVMNFLMNIVSVGRTSA
jgi:hypothetical protein